MIDRFDSVEDALKAVERELNSHDPPGGPYRFEHEWVVNAGGEALEFEGEPVDVDFLMDDVDLGSEEPVKDIAHVIRSYVLYQENGTFLGQRMR
jgi:hypothetical protein